MKHTQICQRYRRIHMYRREHTLYCLHFGDRVGRGRLPVCVVCTIIRYNLLIRFGPATTVGWVCIVMLPPNSACSRKTLPHRAQPTKSESSLRIIPCSVLQVSRCLTFNCNSNGVCDKPAATPNHVGFWVYIVVGIAIFGGTCQVLFLELSPNVFCRYVCYLDRYVRRASQAA